MPSGPMLSDRLRAQPNRTRRLVESIGVGAMVRITCALHQGGFAKAREIQVMAKEAALYCRGRMPDGLTNQ